MSKLKVFVCDDHDGFYPVGVSSIIVAKDRRQAKKLLNEQLKIFRLETSKDCPYTLREIPTDSPIAIIINDGNY